MKRTITITLAALLTSISGWAIAQQPTSLRGEEVVTEDKAPQEMSYQGKKPGLQKPIARTFDKQPPLIPHMITNFDDITLEENQCLSCHSVEKFKEKRAPKIADSHLSNNEVNMTRYQCNSCHVPQVDAKPLVENNFVGHISKTKR
jgi:cytochrome c-type protein NapB